MQSRLRGLERAAAVSVPVFQNGFGERIYVISIIWLSGVHDFVPIRARSRFEAWPPALRGRMLSEALRGSLDARNRRARIANSLRAPPKRRVRDLIRSAGRPSRPLPRPAVQPHRAGSFCHYTISAFRTDPASRRHTRESRMRFLSCCALVAAVMIGMTSLSLAQTASMPNLQQRFLDRPSYFVNIGLEGVGGVAAAGERLNVNQRFQPAGRFSLANSP